MRFRWAALTDEGRVRDHNEDAIWPEPGSGESIGPLLVAVADGMGGHAGGEIASRTAIDTAVGVGGTAALRIQAANLAVLDDANHRPRLAGMGTTLTLAVIGPDGRVDLGHVGDSRAYLFRAGALKKVTTDHSYVSEMMAAGRLTPEEAAGHPYRSVVTRAIGLEPAVDVDTFELEMTAGDRLLICSDGLSSLIDDAAIAGVLKESDPAVAARGLIEAANRAGGDDNISVVIVDAVAE
ncbi:MAG: PP2C family serine/threonine-protein phosphatase [Acidimicrobiia bacterium]